MTHLVNTTRCRTITKPITWWIFVLTAVVVGIAAGQMAAAPAKPETPRQSQATSKTSPAQSPSVPVGPIQYVGPDTFLLLDAEGRPQPVPGMTYEDFLATWKKLNQPANPENHPRFTIESIKFAGQTRGSRAELKFDAVIHLLADGAVDVPLGLVGAILQGEPRFDKSDPKNQPDAKGQLPPAEKSGDNYLDYDAQHGGFVARLTGKSGARQSISLNLIVPLTRDGTETTLPLNCPRAVSSSLSLSVDSPISEARSSSGTVVSKTPEPNRGTRLEIAGPAGQFRLAWQTANRDTGSIASVLNAVGAIRIAIDGRGVRSDARLTVSSFGGAFDQFRVRLPRGAKLIRNANGSGAPDSKYPDSKYRVSEEPQTRASSQDTATTSSVVLVELKEKQQGPVVVDLSTEQSSTSEAGGRPLELAGFEVLGAVRQFGDIGLSVASDWQSRWDIGRDLRQVDPAELDSTLQRSDVTAAFQYDRQPWSLGVRVTPRQSRVHVTPQYKVELLPEEARLDVRLAYQFFGARAFEFHVDLDGWELSGEPVESGGLVDQDRIVVTEKGMLLLPLSQASSRKAEISLSLRRALDRKASKLQLPLPVPLADSVGTGTLSVRVGSEVELLPDLINSTGLAAAPATEAVDRSPNENGAELHFRSLLPNAVFVANRANRGREESAQLAVQIEVGADSAQVDERIEYMVRYEPVKELIFDANTSFPIDDGSVKIALLSPAGGKSDVSDQRTALRFEPIDYENEPSTNDARRLRVVLPQPQIGKFSVSVRQRIPRPKSASTDGALPIPLLSPADAQLASTLATVTTSQAIAVSLSASANASSWKPIESQPNENATGGEHAFSSDRPELLLPLIVSATEAKTPSTTTVDRVWLQTWLAKDIEQDRAAFRLHTTGSQTTIELPPGTAPSEVEVLLDGRPADVSSPAEGRIVVRLGRTSNGLNRKSPQSATHTLELRFRHPIQQSLIARRLLTPPQIDGTTALSQIYWQIVLPGDEHIVQLSDQLSSASQWQWLGSFWGRQPAMSQKEIEDWVGATQQIAPTASENPYLFTGLLPVSSITLVTAPRWLIVLIASSIAMVFLTGCLYLPAAWRRWLLIPLILIIASAAVAYPTAAVLIAQAAAIGVILVPVSTLLKSLVARPVRRVIPLSVAGSSQRAVTPRSDSILVPSAMATASTAPTLALRSSESDR